MKVAPPPSSVQASFENLMTHYRNDYDFYFFHIKKTGSSSEERDFDEKTKIIEKVDRLILMAANLEPDVLVMMTKFAIDGLGRIGKAACNLKHLARAEKQSEFYMQEGPNDL